MCSVVACLSRALDLSGSSSEDRETEGGGRPEITHLQDEERKNRLSHSVLPRPGGFLPAAVFTRKPPFPPRLFQKVPLSSLWPLENC